MKPQLENAFSRAGILYGHLVEGAGTGIILMWVEDGYINYEWGLAIRGIPYGVITPVTVEDLCKYGVSLLGLSNKILADWRVRIDELSESDNDS